jgi:glutathione peroxidase
MTIRQQILKWIYPLLVGYKKAIGQDKIMQADPTRVPIVPFHQLSVTLNNGTELSFDSLKNKKVLLVNTASNCGFTNQYSDLQKLYDTRKENLVLIGFPANDFKEQEKGSDEEIAQFCQLNFGVSFPLAKKSVVVKGPDQNKVFQWLTRKELNGWNDQQPTWNFSKYLVDESGRLTHFFEPAVSPVDPGVLKAIES